MLRSTAITKELAVIERKLSETTNETLKTALKKKQARLKDELKDASKSAPQLAKTLLAQRAEIKALPKSDFNDLIRRLSKKPEYSFLKTMGKSTIRTDLERPAKPVGWRFKGRGNYDKPTMTQIAKGKRNGTVYREVRPIRSDVNLAVRLEKGGVVGQEIVIDYQGDEYKGVIAQITDEGDYIVDIENGRTVLAQKDMDVISLGTMKKKSMPSERKKRFGLFEDGGNIQEENNEMLHSQAVEAKHHVEELHKVLTSKTVVEPWVVAKMERATTDLSDVTHYLDGENKADMKKPIYKNGGKMAFGGMIDENNVSTGGILRMEELAPNETLDEFINNAKYIVISLEDEGFEKDEIYTFLAHMMIGNKGGKTITMNVEEDDNDKTTILVKLYDELSKAKNLVSLDWDYDDDGYNIKYKSGLESESDYHKGELESYTFYADENDKNAIEAVYDLSGYSITSLTVKQALNVSRANEVPNQFDSEYWLDYNDTYYPGPKYLSEKLTNFDSAFAKGVQEWDNMNEDGETLSESNIERIRKFARLFFDKEGYISINIVMAMISQESLAKGGKMSRGGQVVQNITKQLDELGVKYKLSKSKVRIFDEIIKPINKEDSFYDKFERIIDLYNLQGVVKTKMSEGGSFANKVMNRIKETNDDRKPGSQIIWVNDTSRNTIYSNPTYKYVKENIGEVVFRFDGTLARKDFRLEVFDKNSQKRYPENIIKTFTSTKKTKKDAVEDLKQQSENWLQSNEMASGGGVGNSQYCVVMSGGSIGEKNGLFDRAMNKLVKTFDGTDAEEKAKDYAKRMNATLSPGDKKYYRIKYTAKKYNEKQFTSIANNGESNKMVNGGGVPLKGEIGKRYHIFGEVKGKKPFFHSSTNDKNGLSKLVQVAKEDFADLGLKDVRVFVTDDKTDDEIYHFANGGGVGETKLQKLKKEGKLKTLIEVNGQKYFQTIIPNKEEKGYWKRYYSTNQSSNGVLQNAMLDEDDLINLFEQQTNKMASGGSMSGWKHKGNS